MPDEPSNDEVSIAMRRELPPLVAPDLLRARIASSVRNGGAGSGRPATSWRVQLAAGLAIAIASSVATLVIVRQSPAPASLAISDVVGSHIRSMMSNHLTDVTSTDEHNVKPWFDGKVPFAPDVPRLDSVGFPLVGGRVDSVGHALAAALVYGRRKHLINVFVWPFGGAASADSSVTDFSERGYHVVWWVHGDMQYVAVSDLATGELREFVEEFRAPTRRSLR